MAEETIQDWLEQTKKDAVLMSDYLQAKIQGDSSGWRELFAMRLKNDSLRVGGILLTGPDGCGKHTAAAHMVELLASDGYACVFLDGLALEAYSAAQAKERLSVMLDHYYEMARPLCLSLQNMEDCTHRQELLTWLGQTICEYWLLRRSDASVLPLYLVLIDRRERDIPSLLRSRLHLYRVSLPNEQRRMSFFEYNGGSLIGKISADAFVSATEGFTYAQLADLVTNTEDLLGVRGGDLSQEAFLNFVAEQTPEPAREDWLRTLALSAQQLLEQLPQMLANASVAQSGTNLPEAKKSAPKLTAAQTAILENQEGYCQGKRKELEDMPVIELAKLSLGRDFVESRQNGAPNAQENN